jgi:hypothetical protein
MSGVIATIVIASLSMVVPGLLLAFALLYKKTDLHIFEISVIGIIFGLVAPATLTWIESYLINYIHAFSFSLGLFESNAILLTIIGAILCYQQGVFENMPFSGLSRSKELKAEQAEIKEIEADYLKRLDHTRAELGGFKEAAELISKHREEEEQLSHKHQEERNLINRLGDSDKLKLEELHKKEEEKLITEHEREEAVLLSNLKRRYKNGSKPLISVKTSWVWILLLAIMIITLSTRMFGIGLSPHFFEFDPYFDMLASKSILVYGQQYYRSTSAWPTEVNGSVMRVQPLIPYIEAYWYSLANNLGPKNKTFSTSLMSYVGSVYPPITAALLVFAIFMLIYHEYGKYVGLIGAGLTATMPVLFTTFVSGEQLLEPWGIFSLFFFFATYMLAVRNMKSKRLAILAGVAFATTFLGAHYYIVDTGVLTIYIIIQGLISILRKEINIDFYKMNAIVIIVIALFLAAYSPYKAVSGGQIPHVLGVPVTLAGPLFAIILIAVIDYGPKILKSRNIVFKSLDAKEYVGWIAFIAIITIVVILISPIKNTVSAYINISAHYTTPSIPLFMTVEEFIPTGLTYNFGAQGFGLVGADIGGLPVLVWIVSAIALALIIISIVIRKSKTGVFYLAISLPIMFAGFSEVKYLPHLGVVYIMLFCIIIGETLLIVDNEFDIKRYAKSLSSRTLEAPAYKEAFDKNAVLVYAIFAVGIFFISSILSIIFLLAVIFLIKPKQGNTYLWGLVVLFFIIEGASILINHQVMLGESSSITQAFGSLYTYSTNSQNACTIISQRGNSIGADMFCNLVPSYWISATAWMAQNIGPFGSRVLSWWDYGDWINWFGNTNTVLRGDNSDPNADYAAAATFVLGTADGYPPSSLANYMNTNQTQYVLFDQGLVAKWQALDFLACVNINATSRAYAIAEGQAQSPPVPYALGNSQCEIAHDPQFALIPLAALIPTNQTSLQQSLALYCPISNSTTELIKSYIVNGNGISNQTVCVDAIPNSKGVLKIFNSTGTLTNAVIQSSFYEGVVDVSGTPFVEYLMIYLPNGANGTIEDAPSEFYTSNYYKGFFLGNLTGFRQVYPLNATGINFVNGTYPIRIFAIDNFTGSLPKVAPKPSWVINNYTMP